MVNLPINLDFLKFSSFFSSLKGRVSPMASRQYQPRVKLGAEVVMLARNCDLRSLASASCLLLSWISSNSRTFSMAITAWSAKVVISSICFSVKACILRRIITRTPMGIPSRNSGNLNSFAFQRDAAGDSAMTGFQPDTCHILIEVGRKAVACCVTVDGIFQANDGRHIGITEARRRFGQRIEHRPQIEG